MASNNFSDNTIHDRGIGIWTFVVYNPESHTYGPYAGRLHVGKDFHTVSIMQDNGEPKFLISVPSQNVSAVEDSRYVHKWPENQQ